MTPQIPHPKSYPRYWPPCNIFRNCWYIFRQIKHGGEDIPATITHVFNPLAKQKPNPNRSNHTSPYHNLQTKSGHTGSAHTKAHLAKTKDLSIRIPQPFEKLQWKHIWVHLSRWAENLMVPNIDNKINLIRQDICFCRPTTLTNHV